LWGAGAKPLLRSRGKAPCGIFKGKALETGFLRAVALKLKKIKKSFEI